MGMKHIIICPTIVFSLSLLLSHFLCCLGALTVLVQHIYFSNAESVLYMGTVIINIETGILKKLLRLFHTNMWCSDFPSLFNKKWQ